MKRLFAITMVGLLVFAGAVQGASAAEVCSTQIVSCVSATESLEPRAGNLVAVEAASLQRANDYTLMAEDYFAARQRANDADASRYAAMAADYVARANAAEAASLQRANDYTLMAEDYSAALERANEAYAARYTALAEYYARLARRAATMSSARGVSGLYGR